MEEPFEKTKESANLNPCNVLEIKVKQALQILEYRQNRWQTPESALVLSRKCKCTFSPGFGNLTQVHC